MHGLSQQTLKNNKGNLQLLYYFFHKKKLELSSVTKCKKEKGRGKKDFEKIEICLTKFLTVLKMEKFKLSSLLV